MSLSIGLTSRLLTMFVVDSTSSLLRMSTVILSTRFRAVVLSRVTTLSVLVRRRLRNPRPMASALQDPVILPAPRALLSVAVLE